MIWLRRSILKGANIKTKLKLGMTWLVALVSLWSIKEMMGSLRKHSGFSKHQSGDGSKGASFYLYIYVHADE
jgi:hypothetical protein